MKIFLLADNFPSGAHTVTATNKVLYSLIEAIRQRHHQVVFQMIVPEDRVEQFAACQNRWVEELESLGVQVLETLASPKKADPKDPVAYYYPACSLSGRIRERIQETGSDIALIFWTPLGLAATYKIHDIPKYVYYGMPDHSASLARLQDYKLFDENLSWKERFVRRVVLRRLEKYHLKLMNDCDVVTNLCAELAGYYTKNGHPRSYYMQNMWPEASPGLSSPAPSERGKIKIFGSLGPLNATGNTYGLKYIGEEIVPRLNGALGESAYEIHIFGAGEPVASVKPLLQSPGVKLRGWVQDIDGEIRSSHLFLVCNNSGRFKGSHTRFLHAWSLKACCIAHEYNVRANPEMVHDKNVLLARTPDEFVAQILRAIREPDLRKRIGEGGWRTYKDWFAPNVVSAKILNQMEMLVANTKGVLSGKV